MEYFWGPTILGLLGFVAMTIVFAIGAFTFRLKISKLNDLSKFDRFSIIKELGEPFNTINEGDNIILVWMKSSGNYMLKIEYTSKGEFVRINQQLDQTKSGAKGIIFGLIEKIINSVKRQR